MDYYAKKRINNTILFIIILISVIIVVIFFYKIIESKKNIKNTKEPIVLEINYKNYDEIIGCNYYKKDKQYYYMLLDQTKPIINILPYSIDKFSFKPLDPIYAKDKNSAYYMGKIIDGVDIKSFDPIYSMWFKGCSKSSISSINTATGLAKDKNHLYRNGQIQDKIDISTIKFLGNNYIQIKDGIYVLPSLPSDNIRKLELVDTKSFVIVQFRNFDNYLKSNYDAYDRKYYYKKGIIINQNK